MFRCVAWLGYKEFFSIHCEGNSVEKSANRAKVKAQPTKPALESKVVQCHNRHSSDVFIAFELKVVL